MGDANGTDPVPDRTQTQLINERRRRQLNQLSIDPANPNILIAEQIIPADEGGWWIREIGLYDSDGDLVAVANCAPSYKPVLAQGSGRTQVVRMNFIVSSAANVLLKIDPSVVLATRKYVDDSIIHVLPKTRQPGSYRQVTITDRGIVESGSNPTTLTEYEIEPATQEQVDTGTDDSTVVTPKKLRFGFQVHIGSPGYIVFPTWLGGWIVQWHAGLTLQGSVINQTYFPIPFPNSLGSVVVGAYNNAAIGNSYLVYLSDGVGGATGAVSNSGFKTMNNGVTGSAGLSYIAVGS